MRELTEEEFTDRILAISRARKIFIKSGLTDNISIAFELYQLVFAEREREIFLSTQIMGHKKKTVMDRYKRPKCPECGSDMMFRKVPENPDYIKTQLVCSKPDCDTVLNSEMDLDEWMKELKVKNGPI